MQSLRTRITLISLLSGIVIATSLIVAGTQTISRLISDNLITHSRLAANELVSKINQLKALGLEFDEIIDFDEQCRLILSKYQHIAFAGIYDDQGKIRFKSGDIDPEWSASDTVLLDAEQKERQVSTEKYLMVVHPIEPEADLQDGYALIVVDRALLHKGIYDAVHSFIIIAAVLVFLSLAIHFLFLKRSVIQPLGKLVQAVKAVNPENFTGMLQETNSSKGEIGELAQAFTKLLAQLAQAQNEALSQASRAITAEKKLNRTIVESSPLAIYTRDKEGLITGWNKACEQMFGWNEDEVIGKPFPSIPTAEINRSEGLREQTLQKEQSIQVELQRHRKDGALIYVMSSFSPLYDEVGEVSGYLTIAADVTRRKAAEQKIEFMAHHDALTHLPNRRLVQERFMQAVDLAKQDTKLVPLIFVDLDHFKAINDSFGHSIGDAYLKEIAHRLGTCIRTTDTVSRQGGDEFLIVLNGVSDRNDIPPILDKIRQRLQEPILIGGHELSVSMSIGISVYPQDGREFEDLLKKSDIAMYRAKKEGKNTYRFFEQNMYTEDSGHHTVQMALKRALEQNQLQLHYQPQICLGSRTMIGAEALIRWNHPEQGTISPAKFIPIAEECGLIVPIGEWVIREACRQAAQWKEEGFEQLTVAVNLSAAQFKSPALETTIITALNKTGLDAQQLELELTESLLIQDVGLVQATIKRLKKIGVKVSIDDFGTGYSSLSYLKRLDIDKLKIDRSFIKDLATDHDDQAIVKAIVQMAKSLHLKTIAEGVEDLGTLSYLKELQCDEAQGFYFAQPMPAPAFREFVLKYPLILNQTCTKVNTS